MFLNQNYGNILELTNATEFTFHSYEGSSVFVGSNFSMYHPIVYII